MGRPNIPVYGEDVGSCIENIENIISKIKSNKYDNKDLVDLFVANNELLNSILENASQD